MRILQVLLSPRTGGAETLAAALEAEWSGDGHRCRTAYLDDETAAPRSRMERLKRVRRAYVEFSPDIVISHTAIPNMYSRLALPRRSRLACVLHSSQDDFSAPLLRIVERTLRRVRPLDYLVAVSEEARRVYTLRFGDKKALHIIPNGVQKFDICERTGRSVETVLTLARVAPVKNPQLWATVADRVGQERADVSFVWAGPTNGDEEMTALVEEHRGSGRTGRFVGEAANVAEVLATSDILFHPSDRESSGLSVLEAIGTGLPVVCSDQVASGLEPSLIEETFPSGDIEGAVQAVLRVIARYPQAIQKSVGRSVLVQQLHGMDKCAAAYLRLFSGHTKAVDVTHRKSEYQKASPIDGSDSELPGARS